MFYQFIEEINKSRTQQCESLKQQLKLELEQAQTEWRKAEKLRLARLMDSKTEYIKTTVAKSMEPELTRVFNYNKRELLQLREQIQAEIDELKKKLETENEERFKSEYKRFEELYEAEVKSYENEQQKKMMDLSLQHGADLHSVRTELRKELEQERTLFDTQCRSERRKTEIVSADEEEQKMFDSALKEYQNDMDHFWEDQRDLIRSKSDELTTRSAEWRESRERELRRQFSSARDSIIQELDAKSTKDLSLVESRLESDTIERKIAFKKEIEGHIDVSVIDNQAAV